MKRALGRVWGRTYDEWFCARSPVSPVQFAGLLILGIALIVCGVYLLVLLVSRFPPSSLDPTTTVILLIPFGVCFAIIYFGVLHVRRAFAGRP
jgi:hypothetical protein